MLLTNAFRPDTRVKREALALVEERQTVKILCWDRKAELPEYEYSDGFTINRIHSIPSKFGAGLSQLIHYLNFWKKVIEIGIEYKPNVVHCHDLDTLYAGVKIKKYTGCKLIYDAHENYPALMSLHLPKIIVFLLKKWEKWLSQFVDGTITASTVLKDEYLSQGKFPVSTIGNFQNIESFEKIKNSEIDFLREKLSIPKEKLTIAYIGGFSPNRLLLPFIESAKILPNVQFHIWGDGHQKNNVENAVKNLTNVTYHGWLLPDDLPLYFKAMDIIYYCLRLDYPGAIYNAPNTLGQAMAAKKPIIANSIGDLGRIIKDANCGVLLSEVNATTIAKAIDQLMDPKIRNQLGINGFKAAQNNYSLKSMNNLLINIYSQLNIK